MEIDRWENDLTVQSSEFVDSNGHRLCQRLLRFVSHKLPFSAQRVLKTAVVAEGMALVDALAFRDSDGGGGCHGSVSPNPREAPAAGASFVVVVAGNLSYTLPPPSHVLPHAKIR